MSHDLINAHRGHQTNQRTRRDTSPSLPAAHLHINIHAQHAQHQLQLSPSHHFISPNFKIHRRFTVENENEEKRRETRVEEPDIDITCFYKGDTKHEQGVASVSLCDGLVSNCFVLGTMYIKKISYRSVCF